MRSEEKIPDYIIQSLKAPITHVDGESTWEVPRVIDPIEHIYNGNVNIQTEGISEIKFDEAQWLKIKIRAWSNTLKGKKKKEFNKYFNL